MTQRNCLLGSQCATIPVEFGVRGWLLTGPFCGAPLASEADDLLGFMAARFMLEPGTMLLTPSPRESLNMQSPLWRSDTVSGMFPAESA